MLMLSGLKGKAMLVEPSDVPTKAEFRAVVPKHCFERNTAKSLAYAAASVLQSAACVAVGRLIPSALLVPYFSWQHSHAVHHSRTNHITEGETHVPPVVDARPGIENHGGNAELAVSRTLGKNVWGAVQLFAHLVVGWPAYLLWGT